MAHIRHSASLGGLDPPFIYKYIGVKSNGLELPLLFQLGYLLHVMTTMYYIVTSGVPCVIRNNCCANVSQLNASLLFMPHCTFH